jgi:hypothetical protein
VKVHLLLPVKKQFIYRLQANCNILYHTVLPITDRASEALEVHRWRSRTRRCVSYHLVHVSTLFLLPSVLQCTMTRTATKHIISNFDGHHVQHGWALQA